MNSSSTKYHIKISILHTHHDDENLKIEKIENKINQLIQEIYYEDIESQTVLYKSEKDKKGFKNTDEAIVFVLKESLSLYNQSAENLWKISLALPELLTNILNGQMELHPEKLKYKLLNIVEKYKESNFSNPALTIKTLNAINSDYKTITLSSIATQLKVNSSYLSRIISKDTLNPFVQIVQTKKILEGIRLIIETNTSINEISYTIGYKNMHYFYRTFKKMTTITPKKIRVFTGF